MPMTSVNNSTLRTETLAQPPVQTTKTPGSPLLRNINKVDASTQNREVNSKMSWVAELMLNGIRSLKEVIKADKPDDEKIPDYIANGRKIRLAVEALESICTDTSNKAEAEQQQCELFSVLANSTQLMLQGELEHSLPKSLDNQLRLNILSNIYSEQFPVNSTTLLT